MIYVKTPISEKETRRTRKIQSKTKPKTAEQKKNHRIRASGFARCRRESGGTSYQPGEIERGRYDSSRTRAEQERHLYPFLYPADVILPPQTGHRGAALFSRRAASSKENFSKCRMPCR